MQTSRILPLSGVFLPEQDRSLADVGSAKFRLGRRLALAGFFIRKFYGRGGGFFYLFGAYCCLLLLIVAYFGLKRIIHFHVQLYSPTFRRRKSCKSRSRLKRRRESVATGGFRPKHGLLHLNYLYKRDRLAITVRPCNLRQNRRATSARIWGSVRS